MLLHFEKCATTFVKSDCKDAKEHTLYCGTNRHEQDCRGERCVAGYIRQKNFCVDYTKSNNYSFYYKYREKTEHALINAAWLRFKTAKNGDKIYDMNPYTDVDTLVKRLLGIQTNYIWAGKNDVIKVGSLILKIENRLNSYAISISNKGKTAFLLNPQNVGHYFQLLNDNEVTLPLSIDSVTIIKPSETQSFVLKVELQGQILVFKFGQEVVYVELAN